MNFSILASGTANQKIKDQPQVKNFEKYLISFHKPLNKDEREKILNKYGMKEVKEVKSSSNIFYVIDVPTGKERSEWEALMFKNEKDVKYIEPEVMYQIQPIQPKARANKKASES
jgi:ribosomal protein S24E